MIHVSTPETRCDRREPQPPAKQQVTPGQKPIYLSLIYDALRARPEEPSSLEDILNWVRVYRPATYQEYGGKKLRTSIYTSLGFQARKLESRRTIWLYSRKNSVDKWQLHKPVVAITDVEESMDTCTERHARTPSRVVHPSVEGQTRDGMSEPCKNTPPPELRQTRERYHAENQEVSLAINPQVQVESRLASTERRSSHPVSETEAELERDNLTPKKAVPNETTAVDDSPNHHATLTGIEHATGIIPATPNNRPSDIEERQGPADSLDHPGRDGKDEPDYGQIVRELHRLKRECKMQEQKIEAGRNSLPNVDTLTQSASDAQRAADGAQRAADEAQRIADEAQRAAETAKKVLEDCEAKQSQLAADELHLGKLTDHSTSLRAQLDID